MQTIRDADQRTHHQDRGRWIFWLKNLTQKRGAIGSQNPRARRRKFSSTTSETTLYWEYWRALHFRKNQPVDNKSKSRDFQTKPQFILIYGGACSSENFREQLGETSFNCNRFCSGKERWGSEISGSHKAVEESRTKNEGISNGRRRRKEREGQIHRIGRPSQQESYADQKTDGWYGKISLLPIEFLEKIKLSLYP